jgi:hypothetical protein
VSLVLDLFVHHFLCSMDVMHALCADHKEDDDVLLSVLSSLAVVSSMLPE